jgi:hypothetical protein
MKHPKRGVVLFAHDNGEHQYGSMAAYTAGRIDRYLFLPTTLITDSDTLSNLSDNQRSRFDTIHCVDIEGNNRRGVTPWHNSGRWRAWEYTPYEHTLLLDVDYMINSRHLLRHFEQPDNVRCYNNSRWLCENIESEQLFRGGLPMAWATVVYFTRSVEAEQTFHMMKRIQNNYEHYSNIYKFQPYQFRNDYALAIAMRTVWGQLPPPSTAIRGSLLNVGKRISVTRISNTQYRCEWNIDVGGRDRHTSGRGSGYIIITDTDFHMISKYNFTQLMEPT